MQFLKKFTILLLSFVITALIVLYFYLYVNGPIIQAKSAILIDANSGEVVLKMKIFLYSQLLYLN